jgi:hypothetical protein
MIIFPAASHIEDSNAAIAASRVAAAVPIASTVAGFHPQPISGASHSLDLGAIYPARP